MDLEPKEKGKFCMRSLLMLHFYKLAGLCNQKPAQQIYEPMVIVICSNPYCYDLSGCILFFVALWWEREVKVKAALFSIMMTNVLGILGWLFNLIPGSLNYVDGLP